MKLRYHQYRNYATAAAVKAYMEMHNTSMADAKERLLDETEWTLQYWDGYDWQDVEYFVTIREAV